MLLPTPFSATSLAARIFVTRSWWNGCIYQRGMERALPSLHCSGHPDESSGAGRLRSEVDRQRSLARLECENKTAFIGNLVGPFFGHVPNLYTLRGDKIRSAMAFIHSVDRVIALEPETLLNGHDVFRGVDEIRQTMTKVRDATAYLRDRTIDGMNAGSDLWTLMREITLPTELALPQVHGKVPWIVRAIWEEHVGWFRYESTTELYDVPPSTVWPDIVELAGGTAALTERAQTHAEQGAHCGRCT